MSQALLASQLSCSKRPSRARYICLQMLACLTLVIQVCWTESVRGRRIIGGGGTLFTTFIASPPMVDSLDHFVLSESIINIRGFSILSQSSLSSNAFFVFVRRYAPLSDCCPLLLCYTNNWSLRS